MPHPSIFTGSIPALITPFNNGAVDEAAFVALVERQIAAGSHGLVACGTTGESATLSEAEHNRVIELCVETARGRVPVIAGVGGPDTVAVIERAAHAKAVGAHASLAVTPYYNRPNQEGMYAHFAAVADAVELPMILYNVPARTGVDLLPETVARLAALPNVIGLKDASRDLDRVARHRALCGDTFVLLSGEDGSAVGFNALGGTGCISVTANVAPVACAQMQNACAANDFATAREINLRLCALHRALFLEPSPAPAKRALAMLGLCRDEVRLPLAPASAGLADTLAAAMREAEVTA
jgi:4-hydroxy-tetrahydrodipicolinate synthase